MTENSTPRVQDVRTALAFISARPAVMLNPEGSTEGVPMYMLHVSFSKAPGEVEPYADAHRKWVADAMSDGRILFAGVKKSGLGGIIAVRSMEKSALRSLLAEDSYVQADVADYEIIDFDCRAALPNIADLVGI